MPIIEGIRIRNYRVLRDVTLGRIGNNPHVAPLNPMTAVIGKNGVGKSSLFDAFGFLADCLKLGVEEACDARGRGGFDRIRSKGSDDHIIFEVCYRWEPQIQPIMYMLAITKDDSGRPCVSLEFLYQYAGGQPRAFLMLSNGAGVAWKGDTQGQQMDESVGGVVDFGRQVCTVTGKWTSYLGKRQCGKCPVPRQPQARHSHSWRYEAASANCSLPRIYRRLVLELLHPGRRPRPAASRSPETP